MTQRERQSWFIVASLWVTLFLVMGSEAGTSPIFFTPLLSEFGWSRAQLSILSSALALVMGLTGPLVGWLLDRIEARIVMVAGVAVCAAAFLLASRVHSFESLLTAYVMLGIGVSASGLVPTVVIIANWFGPTNRGTAMGVSLTGHSLGASAMALVASYAILHRGWRSAYETLAIPMIIIVIPLVLFEIRSRPPQAQDTRVRETANKLPGLEIARAVRTRSFWMIFLAMFLYGFTVSSIALHTVPFLIGIGYKPRTAAELLSVGWFCSAAGRFLFGMLADRITARNSLLINFGAQAVLMLLLFHAGVPVAFLVFQIFWGLGSGSPHLLLSLIAADSLGLKRFGSIIGIVNVAMTIGLATGPIVTGHVFDVTGSYSMAFEIIAVMYLIAMIAVGNCRTLETELTRLAIAQEVA